MNPTELYNDIQRYCIENADETIVQKYSRFFKEGYDAYGLSREKYEKKLEALIGNGELNLNLVLATGKRLLSSGKYEETSFAIRLVNEFSAQYSRATFSELEQWFYIGFINWAHTDVLCGMVIKQFFEKGIISFKDLSAWRTGQNKFQRRAVPVAMIELLKTTTDYTSFFEFIEPLMLDKERAVQQGLGWFLREAWKLQKETTETFLMKWKNKAPRLIYQYATEKMTSEEKQHFRKEKTR